MVIRRLIRQLFSSFLLLDFIKRYKCRASLIKIKAAQAYVLGVKKTRTFFLGALLVAVAFVFLINGLSLIQAAFFTFSTWSSEVKFAVALVLGGIEFFGAVGLFIYLFREETWGKFSEIHKVLNFVIDEEDQSSNT